MVAPILGWLLTAFAASMGAPFWFDVLNKVMEIRSTIKPKEKSPEEATQDKQAGTAATLQMRSASAGASPGVALFGGPGGTSLPSPSDGQSGVDGCIAAMSATPDEDLPAAEGGVA